MITIALYFFMKAWMRTTNPAISQPYVFLHLLLVILLSLHPKEVMEPSTTKCKNRPSVLVHKAIKYSINTQLSIAEDP